MYNCDCYYLTFIKSQSRLLELAPGMQHDHHEQHIYHSVTGTDGLLTEWEFMVQEHLQVYAQREFLYYATDYLKNLVPAAYFGYNAVLGDFPHKDAHRVAAR